MLQVKVFDEQHEDDLTQSVNQFLADLREQDMMNIQFSTSCFALDDEQVFCFSALIVYRINS